MVTLLVKYDDLDITETCEDVQISAPTRVQMMAVPKRHGGLVSEVPVLDPRRINIRGKIQEASFTACRATIDLFEKTFHRFNKKLRIYDDRYINAYPLGFNYVFLPGSGGASVAYTIDIICADPFWYNDTTGSDSRTLDTGDVAIDITNNVYRESFTINNTGTAFVFPVITVTAGGTNLTTITVRNLTTGRNFSFVGTVLSGNSLVVDCGQFTVENNGVEDLTNWSGSFLWFDPGNNSMQIEGTTVATYAFAWSPRNY